MKNHSLQEFLEFVGQKNVLHARTLTSSVPDMTDDEVAKFENLLNFYIQHDNSTIENVVDKYLAHIQFLTDEQYYFAEQGKYRFSTFVETEAYYTNPQYMSCYTIGIGLSTYLWRVHREMARLFHKYLNVNYLRWGGGKLYFEVGPGHGEYLVTAMQETNFSQYIAVDVSETSVELTKDFIRYAMKDHKKKCEVIHQDFFNYHNDELCDMVVMGEVLEHVENPEAFLDKIHQIAAPDACIFITTAINAPQADHIYLFNNLKEVTDMLEKAGFSIVDYVAANSNNIPLEKAEKRKIPIVCGFILKKI